MNRQAKTPRTRLELAQAELARVFGVPTDWGCRRQPKGKRAKSGQWWRRSPCPVRLGFAACRAMDNIGPWLWTGNE